MYIIIRKDLLIFWDGQRLNCVPVVRLWAWESVVSWQLLRSRCLRTRGWQSRLGQANWRPKTWASPERAARCWFTFCFQWLKKLGTLAYWLSESSSLRHRWLSITRSGRGKCPLYQSWELPLHSVSDCSRDTYYLIHLQHNIRSVVSLSPI